MEDMTPENLAQQAKYNQLMDVVKKEADNLGLAVMLCSEARGGAEGHSMMLHNVNTVQLAGFVHSLIEDRPEIIKLLMVNQLMGTMGIDFGAMAQMAHGRRKTKAPKTDGKGHLRMVVDNDNDGNDDGPDAA